MAIQRKIIITMGLAGFVSWPVAGWTAEGTAADSFDRLEQQIAQQQARIDAQQKALDNEQEQLKTTRAQLENLRGRGGPPQSAPPETVVGQAPSTEATHQPDTAAVSQQTGVLTPRGHVVLEPSLEYQYSSDNQVSLIGYTVIPAITIGLIDVRKVNQSTLIGALTARYGLTNRLEFEIKAPYVYRERQSSARPLATPSSQKEVFNANGNDIGDVEVALRYQFNQGGPSMPYFIGGLRGILPTGKSPFDVKYAPASSSQAGTLTQEELPTGAGFYGVQPSLTAIYPSDPVVFFGGVSYLHYFASDINKSIGSTYIGHVDPGDQIQFNFGMGLALNDRASFSLGYQHTIVEKTKYNGSSPPGAISTQLGQLLVGYSYRLGQSTSLNVSLGAGITSDTPDVDINFRLPFMF
ncbi:MAG: hypothetical protein WBL23_05600 [Salinisphaera sp.]|uniref:hypothetical protein n=1 Tax=Salinisphaera sp. TaxID=1914330 RepID=UPI003C7D0918